MSVLHPESLGTRLVHVYDLYRTAVLNTKYYARRLASFRRMGTFFDAFIALSAPSAAGGWAIWKEAPVSYVWACIAAMAVVLSVLRSILGVQRGVERYSKIWAQYNDMACHLESLISNLQARREWSDEMERTLSFSQKRFRELAAEDDPAPNRRLLSILQQEVNLESPADTFWMPSV